MFRKKHKRLLIVTIELRQIAPSMVIVERKVWYKKCTATTCDSKKVFLGLTEGEFKKQSYYDHVRYFRNEFYASSTTLSSYVWEIKNRKNVTAALTWEVLRTAKAYSNITNITFLMPPLMIITYLYPDERLNRRSELVTKCRHENKFLLKNFNSNFNWSHY